MSTKRADRAKCRPFLDQHVEASTDAALSGDDVTIWTATQADEDELIAALRDAFSGDLPLARSLLCQQAELEGYWAALVRLCFRAEGVVVLAAGRCPEIVGALIAFDPGFRAGVIGAAGYLWTYWRRMGARRLVRLLDFGLQFQKLASADAPAVSTRHIQHLGTTRTMQRRGVGGALLRRGLADATERGLGRAQLEVETGSPAARLYRCWGFEVVSGFSLHGQRWDVMARTLEREIPGPPR